MKRKKSRILPVPGRRGIVDYSVPVAQRAQERAERSRRENHKANQITRDYQLGRRESNYDGSGSSRIMPLIREDE